MKMKKLVSAIAALAMSVSAFAGMATVANAADLVEVDFIGSSTQVVTDPTTAGWTAEATNASYSVGTANVTEVAKPEVGKVAGTTTTDDEGTETTEYYYPTYVSGTTLCNTQRKSTTTGTFTFDKAVTNGVLYFNANVYALSEKAGYHDGAKIYLKDSDGNNVVTINIPGGSGRLSVNDKYDSNYTINTRPSVVAGVGFNVQLTVDLEAQKVTAKLDTVHDGHVRVQSTVTADISAKNIASLATYQTSGRSSNSTWLHLDDIQLYAMTAAETANLKIRYVDENDNELAAKTLTDLEKGAEYVLSGTELGAFKVNGLYYNLASNAETSIYLTDSENTLNVLCECLGDTVDEFYEFTSFVPTWSTSVSNSSVSYDTNNNCATIVNSKGTAASATINFNEAYSYDKFKMTFDIKSGVDAGSGRDSLFSIVDNTTDKNTVFAFLMKATKPGKGNAYLNFDAGTSAEGYDAAAMSLGYDNSYHNVELDFEKNDEGYYVVKMTVDGNAVNFGTAAEPVYTKTTAAKSVGAGYFYGLYSAGGVSIDNFIISDIGYPTSNWNFSDVSFDDYADTNICFDINDGTSTETVVYGTLADFTSTSFVGEGTMSFSVSVVLDVAGYTVENIWLDGDNSGTYNAPVTE